MLCPSSQGVNQNKMEVYLSSIALVEALKKDVVATSKVHDNADHGH
jgi:hypothetical protein